MTDMELKHAVLIADAYKLPDLAELEPTHDNLVIVEHLAESVARQARELRVGLRA
jgi:hypothetical protein